MEYAKEKILTFMKCTKKDKFIKLFKLYLINFINIVEGFGKPTEVSQIKIIKIIISNNYGICCYSVEYNK